MDSSYSVISALVHNLIWATDGHTGTTDPTINWKIESISGTPQFALQAHTP